MTTDQLAKMTPEEKRIAIAEICGLRPDSEGLQLPSGKIAWDTRDWWCEKITSRHPDGRAASVTVDQRVPDYLNSADAITSACRDHITDKVKQAEFSENLIQIINRKLDGQHRFIGATPFHVATAESGDISDAFLLTMLP